MHEEGMVMVNKAGRIEVVHDAICHALAEIVPTLMEA